VSGLSFFSEGLSEGWILRCKMYDEKTGNRTLQYWKPHKGIGKGKVSPLQTLVWPRGWVEV
jgi:hypothetical protein